MWKLSNILILTSSRIIETPSESKANNSQIEQAISLVNKKALASAYACKRRFALQWALGYTTSYQSDHHNRILNGNFEAIFSKIYNLPLNVVEDLTEKIWKFMSPGQRASSHAKRVIKVSGWSAKTDWIYTLSGSSKKKKGLDFAYQAASGTKPPPTREQIIGDGLRFLPEGIKKYEICKECPVKSNCSDAKMQKEKSK